jgi:hypothetical protein
VPFFIDSDGLHYFENVQPVSDFITELNSINNSNWIECKIETIMSKKIPTNNGVYAICLYDDFNKSNHIAYIGCSERLIERLFSHGVLRFLLYLIKPYYKVMVFIYNTDNFKIEEQSFINKFRPFLNAKIYPMAIKVDYNCRNYSIKKFKAQKETE